MQNNAPILLVRALENLYYGPGLPICQVDCECSTPKGRLALQKLAEMGRTA